MSKSAVGEDPKWTIGDDVGDGLRVVAVVTAVGARGPMCWCARSWRDYARAQYATFQPGSTVVYAARAANPFAVVAFHPRCALRHQRWTDPVIRQPWGVHVTGHNGFYRTYYYATTRAETRQWVADRPEVTVLAWTRTSSNNENLHEDPDYTYVEDPDTPLCETSNDAGVTCMEPAALRLEFSTGLVANVCTGCHEPIAAAVAANHYTATPIGR